MPSEGQAELVLSGIQKPDDELILPAGYTWDRWYTKEKSPYEVVPSRVPGGTDVDAQSCRYHPVPPAGTTLNRRFPFEYHPVPPVPPSRERFLFGSENFGS